MFRCRPININNLKQIRVLEWTMPDMVSDEIRSQKNLLYTYIYKEVEGELLETSETQFDRRAIKGVQRKMIK